MSSRIGHRPNLAVLRDEVRATEAYRVFRAQSACIKLDAMENPFGLPEAVQRELGERLAGAAVNRYPDRRTARLQGTTAQGDGNARSASS